MLLCYPNRLLTPLIDRKIDGFESKKSITVLLRTKKLSTAVRLVWTAQKKLLVIIRSDDDRKVPTTIV